MSPESRSPTAASFGAYYFAHCCGRPYSRDEGWLTFFGGIADRIVRDIAPRRVLDAGCAWGLLVEALRSRGVEAFGVDLSSYAIDQVAPEARPFCKVGSIAEPFAERYDLIVCIEVLEHIPSEQADAAIANLCAHTDDILFSSSPLDLREATHVNVQPPEAWAERFARHGFFRDPDFDASFVTSWAARFRRTAEPLPRIVRALERRYLRAELEAHEARAFAVERQNELQAREADILYYKGALDEANRQIEALKAENNTVHAVRVETAERLGAALKKISDIESSAFWRARGLWVRLNRLAGRSR
jgi:SAM-dependent methyltransferase